jgi:hypothetical protein
VLSGRVTTWVTPKSRRRACSWAPANMGGCAPGKGESGGG